MALYGINPQVPEKKATEGGVREQVSNAVEALTRKGISPLKAWAQVKRKPEFREYFNSKGEQIENSINQVPQKKPTGGGLREQVANAVEALKGKGMTHSNAWNRVKRDPQFSEYFNGSGS